MLKRPSKTAGGIASAMLISGIAVLGAAAPAQAAHPDCIVTQVDNLRAKGFCAGNGTAYFHAVTIKCKNTSWNPVQRGDTKIVRGEYVQPGRTARARCGPDSSAWEIIWMNNIIKH